MNAGFDYTWCTFRQQLHLGVIRDIERQQRRKAENIYILEQQSELTRELRKQESIQEKLRSV